MNSRQTLFRIFLPHCKHTTPYRCKSSEKEGCQVETGGLPRYEGGEGAADGSLLPFHRGRSSEPWNTSEKAKTRVSSLSSPNASNRNVCRLPSKKGYPARSASHYYASVRLRTSEIKSHYDGIFGPFLINAGFQCLSLESVNEFREFVQLGMGITGNHPKTEFCPETIPLISFSMRAQLRERYRSHGIRLSGSHWSIVSCDSGPSWRHRHRGKSPVIISISKS